MPFVSKMLTVRVLCQFPIGSWPFLRTIFCICHIAEKEIASASVKTK